ncbi:helicase-related protein, partial [Dickeya dadantii]|uniref:helicase-related protein n=1 Tax=Dickeya dadantii TaxID=204038 RepID=UPI001EC70BE8
RDVAAELLDVYAQRAAHTGFAFKHDREQYQLFCQGFPFDTTPDQAQAINAVLSDMCRPLAMDRLVCGDVGFGKTEVAMRANVDILTLTATPIPRTLNMAMSGIRDLSIIATPPARRLAVKTFVREYDSLVVREAILREILRGGQVYYLYNDVENIEKAAQRLNELVPEARIAIGHGQMRERRSGAVMNVFHHQRFNVLVCTTIIETG